MGGEVGAAPCLHASASPSSSGQIDFVGRGEGVKQQCGERVVGSRVMGLRVEGVLTGGVVGRERCGEREMWGERDRGNGNWE